MTGEVIGLLNRFPPDLPLARLSIRYASRPVVRAVYRQLAQLTNPCISVQIGCEFQFPVFPTGSPYVTSVGGTEWSGGDGAHPVAWSGSGGGFAWQFPRDSHQDDAVSAYLQSTSGLPPSTSYNGSNRAYPDVSAIAVEGTSESSPSVAGIFSLIMDHRLNSGLPPLGFIGPRLYKAMAADPNGAFQSVTQGNTKTSCDSGFPAAAGWDPVTGWGRPQWAGLLKHFGSDT